MTSKEIAAAKREFQKRTRAYEKATGKQMFDPVALLENAPDARYYAVFGERSNGKTYGAIWYALLDYFAYARPMAIVRRYHEDLVRSRAMRLMTPLAENGWITYFTNGLYDHVYYYGGTWYLAGTDDKGKEIKADAPFAYAYELTQAEHDKSSGDLEYANVVFDEFISRKYLVDEFVIYMNTLSTIIRNKPDVRIWMCGNAINPYGCPYWREMGLSHARDMAPGATDCYDYGQSGLRVCVHRTEPSGDKSSAAAYFAFDNPKLSMITGGDWEIDLYPHIPRKIRPMDIRFTFFVVYDGEILHCDVVKQDNAEFITVHKKTTELKEPDHDLIYKLDADPRRNWRQYLNRPYYPVEKRIWDLVRQGKIFFADNMVGEVWRNYLQSCGG